MVLSLVQHVKSLDQLAAEQWTCKTDIVAILGVIYDFPHIIIWNTIDIGCMVTLLEIQMWYQKFTAVYPQWNQVEVDTMS